MKFSGGTVILIVVALALIVAMVITLWQGGSRSRHGYGALPPDVDSLVGSRWRTSVFTQHLLQARQSAGHIAVPDGHAQRFFLSDNNYQLFAPGHTGIDQIALEQGVVLHG